MEEKVSIPFKREGIYKAKQRWNGRKLGTTFQFPSNGKAYTKGYPKKTSQTYYYVSIPFKREGISKEMMQILQMLARSGFQFPSNGKAYTKSLSWYSTANRRQYCFNSLQTGRHIQSAIWNDPRTNDWKFQFPSNGKAYTKAFRFKRRSEVVSVSIPFKREGIYKAWMADYARIPQRVSIPFKREGIYKDNPKR